MAAPMNRHHPKQHRSPTWDFSHKSRPPEDSPQERADKDRKIAEHIEKRGVTKSRREL